MKIQLLKLTKHFGANNAGEVAGFSADTAAHILKSQGGVLIGDFDTDKNLHVVRDGEDVIVEAVRDSSGNLVEKAPPAPAPAAPAKKEEPKK